MAIRNVCGLAFLILFALPSVSSGDDARSGVDATNRAWEAAVLQGDGAAIAALYTTDGQLLPVQSGFVTGTQAIQAFWQGVFDAGTKGAKLETLEFESHGNSAHEVGKYTLMGADGQVLDRGKFIVIWKKDGKTWKLHRDIWTTSVLPSLP
jgi:uncharacterized protein (TIGR02246 family)